MPHNNKITNKISWVGKINGRRGGRERRRVRDLSRILMPVLHAGTEVLTRK